MLYWDGNNVRGVVDVGGGLRTADILERVTLGRVGFGLALQNRDLSTVGRKKLPG